MELSRGREVVMMTWVFGLAFRTSTGLPKLETESGKI